ncbi:response regulator transcription factor [Streptomyces violens]|uniref:response regulator transcription factor n=1 Tax=Streptomyces violens TaxID=66377 RepID=UPI000A4BE840|nr:response regulator transcription factor [Streptomyces violens]
MPSPSGTPRDSGAAGAAAGCAPTARRPVIALIEDEPDLAAMSRAHLEREGFAVVSAPDARSGQAVLRTEPVDLVVLDLGLPDGNGLDLLRGARDAGGPPMIIITGRGEETDRILGLELGADDYMVKPFSQRELAARIRAVLRRAAAPRDRRSAGRRPVLRLGDLIVDTGARQVRSVGGPIAFTPREYALLEFLAASPGQTFSPGQLMGRLWDGADWQDPATVTEHVYRVRRKLMAAGVGAPRITTVRGFGYRLDVATEPYA